MPRITYIEHNGTPHPIDVPVGKSVMQGAHDMSAQSQAKAAE